MPSIKKAVWEEKLQEIRALTERVSHEQKMVVIRDRLVSNVKQDLIRACECASSKLCRCKMDGMNSKDLSTHLVDLINDLQLELATTNDELKRRDRVIRNLHDRITNHFLQ